MEFIGGVERKWCLVQYGCSVVDNMIEVGCRAVGTATQNVFFVESYAICKPECVYWGVISTSIFTFDLIFWLLLALWIYFAWSFVRFFRVFINCLASIGRCGCFCGFEDQYDQAGSTSRLPVLLTGCRSGRGGWYGERIISPSVWRRWKFRGEASALNENIGAW